MKNRVLGLLMVMIFIALSILIIVINDNDIGSDLFKDYEYGIIGNEFVKTVESYYVVRKIAFDKTYTVEGIVTDRSNKTALQTIEIVYGKGTEYKELKEGDIVKEGQILCENEGGTVKSTCNGEVVNVHYINDENNQIRYDILDFDSLCILSEIDLSKRDCIKKDTDVRVVTAVGRLYSKVAHVDYVVKDNKVKVETALPERMYPGQECTLEFVTEKGEEHLCIIDKAVSIVNDRYYAYKYNNGDKEKCELTIGQIIYDNGDDDNVRFYEVLDGLEEGDRVIFEYNVLK